MGIEKKALLKWIKNENPQEEIDIENLVQWIYDKKGFDDSRDIFIKFIKEIESWLGIEEMCELFKDFPDFTWIDFFNMLNYLPMDFTESDVFQIQMSLTKNQQAFFKRLVGE